MCIVIFPLWQKFVRAGEGIQALVVEKSKLEVALVMLRFSEFSKQHAVELVARGVDFSRCNSSLHAASWFMQMRAVVKLALRNMGL